MSVDRFRFQVSAAVLLCLGLATASPAAVNSDPALHSTFYENATRYVADGDYPAAIVELKNALQHSPGHVPSRVLLGRAYLHSGDATSAEKEFALALTYGADETLVLAPLGNALLLQRKHEEILKRVRSLDPVVDASAEIQAIRGQALMELGRLDEAEAAFRSAAWAAPGHVEPLLGVASVLMARGKVAEAAELIGEAVRLAPQDPEVWFRKSQLELMTGDEPAARELLDRVISAAPHHLRARLSRAALRMRSGDAKGARDDADYILETNPRDTHAVLLSAQANARLGQGEEALDALNRAAERIESVDPDFLWRNPAALNLAGKINFLRQNFEKVHIYLTQYFNLRPRGSPIARKLLGLARMEIGNPEGAEDILEPLVREDPTDVEALLLLGDAHMRAGHYLLATAVLEKAVKLAVDDPGVRTRLALSRMGAGRPDEAVASLEAAFDLDSSSMRTGILLAFVQLRHGDVGKAADTASTLRSRHPDNPVTVNLSGVVLRAMGRIDEARDTFRQALAHDPGFEPAMFNLAGLERDQGNTAAAARHYREILERNPQSVRGYVELSDFEREQGRLREAVSLLKKAIVLAPGATQPSLRLIEHHLSLGDTAEALRIARDLADRHPQDARVLEELARAQLAAGQPQRAMHALREAARYAGYDGGMLLRVGQAQVTLGDYDGARWTYTKAAETDRRNAANMAMARLMQRSGGASEALQFARGLLALEPHNAASHLVHGEVLANLGRLPEAIAAYERSLALAPSSEAAVGLFEVLVTAGEQTRGLDHLAAWVERYPDDLVVRRALGLGYIAANQIDRALEVHEALRARLPEDPLILNNLARIYQMKNDPRAREFGERAVAIAPHWPIALDTLGWIHVTEGRPDLGLPLLRDAHARAATNPVIRYHLAAALGELGRSREALAQLDYLIAREAGLAWIGDVRSLRETLARQ